MRVAVAGLFGGGKGYRLGRSREEDRRDVQTRSVFSEKKGYAFNGDAVGTEAGDGAGRAWQGAEDRGGEDLPYVTPFLCVALSARSDTNRYSGFSRQASISKPGGFDRGSATED